jgi:dUTP pyrophosphatase
MIQFQLMNKDAKPPARGTDQAAGFDLYSTQSFDLRPGVRHAFPNGVRCAIPEGWCGMIYPRSGLAVKQGLDKLAGLIDSDYRGDIHAVLYNSGDEVIEIKAGDRIAQMVVVPYMGDAVLVDDLDDTDRGDGGFGSTGR